MVVFLEFLGEAVETHRLTGDFGGPPWKVEIYGCFLPGFGGNVGGSCRNFFLEKH